LLECESAAAPNSHTEDPIRLRVTAETCRRLVRAVDDAETVARLTDLAKECERKLSALADRFDGEFQSSD
jgi:hypothetical protein